MGEYAIRKSDGERIKIGTCEQMYYLRADQVDKIMAESGSVNPASRKHAESIRFRFPFPQEDGIKPGDFNDYDFGLGLYGIEPPTDIDHYSVHFSNNGLMLSIPCPRSKEGKESKLKVGYNGYSGPVHIHSQRLVGDQLVLILRCGDCGALYRVPSLEEAKPVLDVLAKYATDEDFQHKKDEAYHKCTLVNRGDYYREIARRIVAGYTDLNFWTAIESFEGKAVAA